MMAVNLQCLLGLQCKDFVMLAADQTTTQSIIILKDDENKIHQLEDRVLMAVAGEAGDASQFTQYLAKNLQLYRMRNKYGLDTPAVVHFTRKSLADGLRSGSPPVLNLLVAGYDEDHGAQLFSLDFLATSVQVPYAAHGFGGMLSMSILDYYHSYSLSPAAAYKVLARCVREIRRRLFTALTKFQVKMVGKDGVRDMPTIHS